jgi:1-deoxy-D-xylulose-5-phosphate reductoisomerase
MKGLSILGSTGSIGANALRVVGEFPHDFEAIALAAGRNISLLAQQIRLFRPRLVSVQEKEDRERLRTLLADMCEPLPEILWGPEGNKAVATHPDASLALTAMVGAVGLEPTLAAIQRGITVAIANKEPLVMAGHLCMQWAQTSGAQIIPVDSEHSAIYQCLRGNRKADVRRLWLTGSGGPFRAVKDLGQVTVGQALAHPTWAMGPKITIDSATLMNKGLEVIEAHWLFDIAPERIQVLIHPESIIHSMVEYVDGSVVAQLGPPDMRIPIAYALGYPARLPLTQQPLNLIQCSPMNFEPPDLTRFPCLGLAYAALAQGGTFPTVLNASNEVAVDAFLNHHIQYLDIYSIIEQTLSAHQPQANGHQLESLLDADRWARSKARSLIRCA